MEENEEDYAPFVDGMSWKEYAAKMRVFSCGDVLGEFGGHQEIQAMGRMLGVHFLVVYWKEVGDSSKKTDKITEFSDRVFMRS